jgi:protein involved in sex pheromone biosynthesis
MKKLFTLVLLGTMFSLAACESKKAEEGTESTDMSAPATTDTTMMAPDTTMMMDTTAMDTVK